MNVKNYLYCYKMTHDTGFAPNPYNKVLTLATCKPTIRRCAKENYWVSGWTAVSVQGKDNKRFEFREGERLIYLAKVSEVIKIEDYWNDERFKDKKPILMHNGKPVSQQGCGNKKKDDEEDYCYNSGDNIYEPIGGDPMKFKQHPNGGGHGENDIEHDLSGNNVLICEEFYYFGVENAVEVKNKPKIPRCKKIELESEDARNIIETITKNYPVGIYENNTKQERV